MQFIHLTFKHIFSKDKYPTLHLHLHLHVRVEMGYLGLARGKGTEALSQGDKKSFMSGLYILNFELILLFPISLLDVEGIRAHLKFE